MKSLKQHIINYIIFIVWLLSPLIPLFLDNKKAGIIFVILFSGILYSFMVDLLDDRNVKLVYSYDKRIVKKTRVKFNSKHAYKKLVIIIALIFLYIYFEFVNPL